MLAPQVRGSTGLAPQLWRALYAGPIGPLLTMPILGGIFGAIYHPGFGLDKHQRARIAAEPPRLIRPAFVSARVFARRLPNARRMRRRQAFVSVDGCSPMLQSDLPGAEVKCGRPFRRAVRASQAKGTADYQRSRGVPPTPSAHHPFGLNPHTETPGQ